MRGAPITLVVFVADARSYCRPLRRLAEIQQRQRAVDDFMNNQAVNVLIYLLTVRYLPAQLRESVQGALRELPDLERLLSRIHAQGIKRDVYAARPWSIAG